MGFNFYQKHVEVGLTDFSKLEQDPKTNEYRHMNPGFIRPRPIELNDEDIEMDPDSINQMDTNVYIGDDIDDDSYLKKDKNR